MSFTNPAQLLARLNRQVPEARGPTGLSQTVTKSLQAVLSAKAKRLAEIQECNKETYQCQRECDQLEARIRHLRSSIDESERQYIRQVGRENESFKGRLNAVIGGKAAPQTRSDVWQSVKLLRLQLQEEYRVQGELTEWREYLKEHLARFTEQNSNLVRLGM